MNLRLKTDIERIEQIIDAMMQVAQGDYNIQVSLSEKNDHLDALSMGFNTMVDDLKAGKKIEIENKSIKKINDELSAAKMEAEESNRLKSAFISNLSHEIRTPMNGIIGFSSLLAEGNMPDETRNNYINLIINSSQQLLRIIDDILEISRLETRQLKVLQQEVNINELMIELFNIFNLKPKINSVPLYLKRTLPDESSIIYTDRSKLTKVLGNLLENAIKYTSAGKIELGYNCIGNDIEFYVKDTGIGISKDNAGIHF